jgi:hypothetical protein
MQREQVPTLSDQPVEIHVRLAGELELSDLISMSLVNKYW